MSIELKDKLVTLESLGVVYDSEVNERTEAIANEVTARNAAIVEAINQAETGAPTKVELVSQMTNPDKNYLYIGEEQGYNSGHIYYLVDGAPVDKGVFGGTNIDDTLTISGQAADAKVTGDKIEEIKEDLSDMADIVPIEGYVIGKALDTSVNPVKTTKPVTNAECRHVVVDCKPGDRFIINAVGASGARAWCFVNSNDYLIGVSEVNATVSNLVLTAPYDAAKLIINDKYTDPPLISYKGYKRDEEVAEIKKSQEVISFEEEYFDKVLIKGNLVDTSVTGLYGGTQGYPSYIYLPHPGDGEYFKNPFTTVNQQLHIAFIGSGDDPLSITNKTAGNTVDHWELNSGLYKWVFEETAITLYKYSSMANYNAGNAESINEYELAEIPVKWRISGRWWPSNKQLGITTYPSATYVPVGDHYEYRLKWKPITVDNLALLFEILRNVVYTSDQRDNIDALYDALSVRGE